MDIDVRVRVLEEALEAKHQERMEQDLRNELRRADAKAARVNESQEEARAARAEAAEARAAQEKAALAVGEYAKAVLAKAATAETEGNIRGCTGIEGADTGNKNYNPAPVEERSDFEWVGNKTNNTKLLDGPRKYEEEGAPTTKSGEGHKNNILLEAQRYKRPPPKRDQADMDDEAGKQQRVSDTPNNKHTINIGYREGVLDSMNLLSTLPMCDGGKSYLWATRKHM